MCPLSKICNSVYSNLNSIIPEKNPIKRKKMKLYFLLIQNFKNKNLILMKKNLKTGMKMQLYKFDSVKKL